MAESTVGTATFLMTDIEGSTRLWESIPDRMPDLLARHDGIVAAVVVGNRGSLVKLRGEGDSHFAVFGRSGDAVAAAIALQRRLAGDPELGAVPIRVRVGIHTGEATFRGMDYYGPAVNRCARIRGVGLGGQILVSEVAMSLARDAAAEAGFLDLGHHRLRDLLRPERLFQVVAEGLRRDFPEPPSLNGSSIPQQVTSFVGRERALAEVGAGLVGARLLTLLGAGGVGKTRLAFQAAAESASRFPDGVAVVELAEVPTDDGVAGAVAAALGVADGEPLDALRGRRLLLVVDNCEHVLGGVRALVRRILQEAPDVCVLATSRQTLRLAGEATHEVHPLGLPPVEPSSVEELLLSEAGRLFVERAEAVAPRFEPNAGNLAAIARVCARLDGLPLAIELAAARANVLSPAQIDERLARRFQLLDGGRRSDEGRHATMREAVAWSFRMLEPAERTLLGRLTAFRGGWTFDAAEAALEGRWDLDDDPLDVLQALVERSLVVVEELSGDVARYRLLETIRDYALESAPPEEIEAASAGLFAWADAFAPLAAAHLETTHQRLWFDRLDAERENLRLAVLHGVARPELGIRSLRIVAELHRFWIARGHYALGRALLEPALEAAQDAPAELRAKATNLLGVLHMCQGSLEPAAAWLARGLDLAREIGDASAEGALLCNLGMIAWERKNGEAARRHYEDAVSVLRAAGDRGRLGPALLNLGNVLIDLDRPDEAAETLQASLGPLEERGDLSRIAFAVGNLGYLAVVREDWDAARRHVQDCLGAYERSGDWKGTMNTLVSAATILLHDGDLGAAATVRGTIEKMGRIAQAAPTPRDEPRLAQIDASLSLRIAAEEASRLRLKGSQMDPLIGVEYALSALKKGNAPGAEGTNDERRTQRTAP